MQQVNRASILLPIMWRWKILIWQKVHRVPHRIRCTDKLPSPPGFPGSSQAQSLLRYSLSETEVVQDSPSGVVQLFIAY